MKSVRLPHYLYTASLFALIFLTAVCIAISAADVIIQALSDKTSTGKFDFRNLIVVSCSYVILVMKVNVTKCHLKTNIRHHEQQALASLLFSCSRMLTVRASLQDIPKLYIPIKKDDLPTVSIKFMHIVVKDIYSTYSSKSLESVLENSK